MSRWHTTEFDFYPEHAFKRRPGGRMTLEGGNKGGGQDGNVGAALQKQADTNDKMLQFVMQSYQDNKPMQDKLFADSQADRERQLGLSDKAEKRGDDAYELYQSKGKGVISKSLDDAQNWDSEGNLKQAADKAQATYQDAADNAERQQTQALTRMGINPNSGKFASANNAIATQKAMGLATAVNGARDARAIEAANLRAGASNTATGLNQTAAGYSAQASGTGSAANGMAGQGLNSARVGQQMVTSGMNQASSNYGSNANGYLNLGNAQDARDASAMSGLGSLAGMGMSAMGYADGGVIKGPGTGTSDDVPAVNGNTGQRIQLSNGEYIVSADTVRAKGREFFDKLQAKYHRPVGNLGAA